MRVLGDDDVHLRRSGFDLALAVGPLADSNLVAVKLDTTECGAFGAPGYFERKGQPLLPEVEPTVLKIETMLGALNGSTFSIPEAGERTRAAARNDVRVVLSGGARA